MIIYLQVKIEEDVHEMQFDKVIICAGAWSGQVGQMAGIGRGEGCLQYAIPVEPRFMCNVCYTDYLGPGARQN